MPTRLQQQLHAQYGNRRTWAARYPSASFRGGVSLLVAVSVVCRQRIRGIAGSDAIAGRLRRRWFDRVVNLLLDNAFYRSP